MASNLAPIVLFTYNRPDHTLKTLAALSHNLYAHESELFVFCDGAKHPDDEELVQSVRDVVRSKQWCGKVHIVERASNWGLANSIIDGVTEMCKKFGKVIVLEDDLVTSPYFLEYMNHALDRYTESSQVMQISGHMYPLDLKTDTDAIFLPYTSCWGWATWNRAWKFFDVNASAYFQIKNNKQIQDRFNLKGSYPYFKMLEDQLDGKISSWAIRWYLSVFSNDGLVLHPAKTLVSNIGVDGSGTHGGVDDINEFVHNESIRYFPETIEIDNLSIDLVASHLTISDRGNKTIKSKIKFLVKKFKLDKIYSKYKY
jgi:hypothetical protein